jgi:ABC-type transport system substrate-binding protein
MSKKIEGPVAPSQPDFDPTVKQPAYNPDSAKTLLTEAGWKMGPDGILQKMIGGTLTPFKFTFQIPSGSEVPKQILLIVVNDMKKVGISAEISQLEFSVFLQNMRNRQFDAHMASWIGNMTGPEGVEDEISQKWESTQIKNKGSNEDAYSNPEADKLMEAIKVEPDRAKRFEMSHRLQHIVVDDQPQTFLWSTPERIAWLDRFDNFEFFPSRPPFAPAFWIVRGSGVKRGPHDAVMSMNPSERTEPQ